MKNILKVLSNVKNYKKSLFLHLFFNVLSTVFSLFSFAAVAPFLTILFGTTEGKEITNPGAFSMNSNWFINKANYELSILIQDHSADTALFYFCVFIILLFLFRNISLYLSLNQMAVVRTGMVKDLRSNLFTKILSLPISYFTEEKKGHILSKSSNDINEIETSVLGSLELLFRAPIKIILFLSTLLIMSPKLTLVMIIILPISGFLISTIGKSIRAKSKSGQKRLANVLAVIEETLGGIRIIKSFTAENYSKEKFEKENQHHFRVMLKLFKKQYLSSPFSELTGAISIVILLWIGGRMVMDPSNPLTGEYFITYLVIFSQLIQPAKSFSQGFFKIQKGIASIDRVEEVMNFENPIKEISNPKDINSFNSVIELKSLNFGYDSAIVLKNINLAVHKGEMVALVGPSGGGKSTLVDMIPRFYDPQKGTVEIDGTDIKSASLISLRKLFGIVSQESVLFNDTVKNNICLGDNNPNFERMKEAADVAFATDFIQNMPKGFESNIGEAGAKLSGGQRQRISIARAVYKNPPILILDEATSALDTQSEKEVQSALDNLMKDRTSIVIAHRLSTILNADKIIVIDNGEIVEFGTHQELIEKNGLYKSLYELQSFS